jgi:hypothetical protein
VKRIFTDVSRFRSPLIGGSLTLTGLGSSWPAGRSYYDTSRYLSPYQAGYFQSNSMGTDAGTFASSLTSALTQAAQQAAAPPFYTQPAAWLAMGVVGILGFAIGRAT